jgi:hypothetical protein
LKGRVVGFFYRRGGKILLRLLLSGLRRELRSELLHRISEVEG